MGDDSTLGGRLRFSFVLLLLPSPLLFAFLELRKVRGEFRFACQSAHLVIDHFKRSLGGFPTRP